MPFHVTQKNLFVVVHGEVWQTSKISAEPPLERAEATVSGVVSVEAVGAAVTALFDPVVQLEGSPPPLPAPQEPQTAVMPVEVRHCPLVPIPKGATEFAPFPRSSDPVDQPEGIPSVKAPVVLTGEPEVVKPVGAVRPTLVTVPEDPAPQACQTMAVPFEPRH